MARSPRPRAARKTSGRSRGRGGSARRRGQRHVQGGVATETERSAPCCPPGSAAPRRPSTFRSGRFATAKSFADRGGRRHLRGGAAAAASSASSSSRLPRCSAPPSRSLPSSARSSRGERDAEQGPEALGTRGWRGVGGARGPRVRTSATSTARASDRARNARADSPLLQSYQALAGPFCRQKPPSSAPLPASRHPRQPLRERSQRRRLRRDRSPSVKSPTCSCQPS